MFDFKNAEAAKEVSFLKPGVYQMRITEIKLDKFPKGSPYLGITFETEDGLKLTEKMGYGSDKAAEVFKSRLQYLHEAWTNKKLDKVFKKIEEVEAYFAKVFVNPKAGTRKIVVGGEDTGTLVYAALPFTAFIVPDDADLEEGEFEKGDDNWKKYVKPSSRKSDASGKKNGILNENDDDDDNDTPPAKSNGKAKASKEAEAEDEDDTPW